MQLTLSFLPYTLHSNAPVSWPVPALAAEDTRLRRCKDGYRGACKMLIVCGGWWGLEDGHSARGWGPGQLLGRGRAWVDPEGSVSVIRRDEGRRGLIPGSEVQGEAD